MLLWLPVIMIPLLSVGFYALGGGREIHIGMALTKGLNMNLPEAKFGTKKKGETKMGLYREAEQDSIRLRERRKMDPYYGWKDSGMELEHDNGVVPRGTLGDKPGSGGLIGPTATDTQAGELKRNLELLKSELTRQQQVVMASGSLGGKVPGRMVYPGRSEETPMPFGPPALHGGQGDPDLDKLNSLMDKVLKVRYPGDAPLRDTSPVAMQGRPVLALSVPAQEEVMTTLPVEDKDDLETGFIELDDRGRGDSLAESMIAAVVDGAQTLVSGEEVVFRTAADAMLGGTRVPKGTLVSGKAVLSGERLLISVNVVRTGSKVLPVALEVLDMDGMTGIRVKGSINRDASKESANEAVSSLGVTSLDPGIAGQATAAGLQAARSLLSRKIRLVRVGLPAGYKVWLRNRER